MKQESTVRCLRMPCVLIYAPHKLETSNLHVNKMCRWAIEGHNMAAALGIRLTRVRLILGHPFMHAAEPATSVPR